MKKLVTLFFLFSLIALNIKAQFTGSLTIYVTRTSDGLQDQTVVGFNPNSTDTVNSQYDANKYIGLPNRPALYTINSGQLMSINIMNSVATVPAVPMALRPGGNSEFVMSFVIQNFDSSICIFVQDSQANNLWHNARSGNYTFSADSSEDWNRFVIHFTCFTGIKNINEDEKISIYPNPVSVGSWQLAVGNDLIGAQVEILNDDGRVVYKSQIKGTHSEIPARFAGGVYLLRIASGANTFTKKLIRL